MHHLIEHAKNEIRAWSSDDPRELSLAVAALCRGILDDGELPQQGADWPNLRQAFDVTKGQSIAETIVRWDDLCCRGEFDLSRQDAFVKLGIVTWTVKMLLKKLGMLSGPEETQEFEEWKAKLIQCLDRYILPGGPPT